MSSRKRAAGQLGTLRQLLSYLWPADRADLRRRVVWACAALVVSKVFTVASPFAFKYAVDDLTDAQAGVPPDLAQAAMVVPVAMILAYAAGRIIMVVFAQIRDALFTKVGQSAVRHLARETFVHLHALSLSFHLERRTGGLSRVIERGTKGIEIILRFAVFNTVPTLIEILFVCGILWWHFGGVYAGITAVSMTAYVWFTYRATEWRIGIRRAMNDADTDANVKAIDSLLNFETVKYFGNEAHETQRFDGSMAVYEKAAIKTYTSLAVLNSGQTIIFTAGMAVCMVMAGFAVAEGTLTVGDLILINAMLIQLYLPLNFLGTVYRDIKQGLIDLEEMFALLSVKPAITDPPGAPALKTHGAEITFDKVSFAYDAGRPILNGVSFRIPAGHTVAIAGPSGAGKSTISRLLFRFYEPTAGTIAIDGQNISEVSQASLRAALGMVPQDTVLFNDTIEYNIGYGAPGAGREQIERAARLARIHDFVSQLPQGYQSLVGERGLKLSGGEKQRVSIARTILKDPPILVLDEATSALDSLTEQEIQDALKTVSENRTTVVIAHRLSTIVDADEIIILDGGRIAERGRHAALLQKNGLYATMWDQQRQADQARRLARAAGEGP